MKVALVQLGAAADKKKNLQKAKNLCLRAIRNKAEFILLPELFYYRGALKNFVSLAEPISGESLSLFTALAKKYKVYILAGSVYEKIPGSKKVFNTSVLINPQGKITAKYRKIH